MKLTTKKTAATRATRTTKLAKPTLTLKADRLEVGQEQMIAIQVAFKGLDKVDLSIEPKKGFTIDLKSIAKPGLVRLRAKKDGTTTLIASGRVGSGEVIRKMIHVKCLGPVVRILACGYLPQGF